MELPGRTFIARHGETVFNAARRMQGVAMDTPLTRAGFTQADAMGAALVRYFGTEVPPLALWASTSGRALQTLAVVCEHIGADWHTAIHDARLCEIDVGRWGGRTYAEISAEQGPIVDPQHQLFSIRPPEGEWYDGMATRLAAWVETARNDGRDRLVLMHGVSSRVLRGLLTSVVHDPRWGCGIAANLSQGSMVVIENGRERVVVHGNGAAPA
jgi:broad specificity phosphatase PhoE